MDNRIEKKARTFLNKMRYSTLFSVPGTVKNGSKSLRINLLLDIGSNVTIMTNRVVRELGLQGLGVDYKWTTGGIANYVSEHDGWHLDELDIYADDGSVVTAYDINTTDALTNLTITDRSPLQGRIKDKEGLKIKIPKPAELLGIDLLIGTNNPEIWLFRDYIRYKDYVAIKTILGWSVSKVERIRLSGPREGSAVCGVNQVQTLEDLSRPPNFDTDLQEAEREETKVYTNVAQTQAATDSKVRRITQEEGSVLQNVLDILKMEWDPAEVQGAASGATVEEAYCIERLRDSYRSANGKAYVDPLWKPGQPEAGLNNFKYSYHRMKSVLKKLDSDKDFRLYNQVFEDYVKQGIVDDVTDQVKNPSEEDGLYWAHFPVYNPKSETSPIRPVMDGKAKCLDGKSINDVCFYSGPNLINDLTQVLTRFRRFDVAFTGDVSKMFLKIRLPERFKKYYRFLWVDSDNKDKLRILQFNGHLFGNNGSPTCAIYATQRNAEDLKDALDCAEAVDVIKEDTIVDDHLGSCPTVKGALKIITDLVKIHANIGLKLAKVATNNHELSRLLPEEVNKAESMMSFDKYCPEVEYAPGTVPKAPHVRTLGQYWNMVKDAFTYSGYAIEDAKWTKVSCLSQAHKVFDPLGFAAPVLLESKLFLQSLWQRKADWKDPLTQEETDRWMDWLQNLPQLKELSFTRVLLPGDPKGFKEVQLHVFTDASKEAYGAVAYVRVSYKDSRAVHTAFVQCKNRVNPVKLNRTIPKLELMSIELGTRLAKHCQKPLRIKDEDIYLWSDSKTALQWIRMEPGTLTVLCHNYTKKILNIVPVDKVNWVAGTENPADLPTRPKTVKDLLERIELWRRGPIFLAQEAKDWPKLPDLNKSPEVLAEVKKEFKLFKEVQSFHTQAVKEDKKVEERFFDPVHYRDYAHMVRIMTMVIRFIRVSSKKVNSGSDTRIAKLKLVYLHQKIYFKEVFGRIKSGTLPFKHVLGRLGAEVHNELGTDLIRLTGRTRFAEYLDKDTRCPLLLDPADNFTTKLVQHFHQEVLRHVGGIKCLLCEINKQHWIVGGVPLLKSILKECYDCRRKNPGFKNQRMSALPDTRIPDPNNCVPVFTFVAMDAAGPWTTRFGRGKTTQKRWILVFRCAQVGAIHFEMLYDLSEDGFLRAFSRFCNTYQVPKVVYSDQGTNFVGGKNELNRLWDLVKEERPEIEFNFSPAHAAHFNGLVERYVAEAKKALNVVLKTNSLSDEELITALSSVQKILNDRPIGLKTDMVQDPLDLEALTPAHFQLRGRIGESLAPTTEVSSGHAKRFTYIRELVHQFWRRFCNEVSSSLRAHNKWLTGQEEFKVGDIVTLLDESRKYPLGRIVEVTPGSDGISRRFKVKTSKQTIERPFNKLSLVHRPADQEDQPSEVGSPKLDQNEENRQKHHVSRCNMLISGDFPL